VHEVGDSCQDVSDSDEDVSDFQHWDAPFLLFSSEGIPEQEGLAFPSYYLSKKIAHLGF
jgi:hypothetical protein